MSKAIVNMTPNPSDIQTIHCSQGDTEAREWEFELHNNGEVIDSGGITEQMVFKSYEGGTEQILPENGAVPVTAPFVGDIKYPDATRTDQEFLYRQSPTEEDGLAKITDIKGNTLVWNQLIQNGNFDVIGNWTRRYAGSISVANNILTYTNNSGQTLSNWQTEVRTPSFSIPANHVFYCHFDIKPEGYAGTSYHIAESSSNNVAIIFNPTSVPQNVWTRMTFLGSFDREITNLSIRMLGVSNDNGATSQMKNFMLVDLTKMGLDSLTVDEFTSLFPLSYYAYNQGTLLSFNGNGIKTVGKNLLPTDLRMTNLYGLNADKSIYQFNTSSASFAWSYKNSAFRVTLPSGQYKVGFIAKTKATPSITRLILTDSDNNFIVDRGGSLNNLERGEYSFSLSKTTDLGLCVKVYDGVWWLYIIDAESEMATYEPYTSSILSLPISTYFPNGMNGVNDVHDKLSENGYVKKYQTVSISISSIYVRSDNPNCDFAVFVVPYAWKTPIVNAIGEKITSIRTNYQASAEGELVIYSTNSKQLCISIAKGSTLEQAKEKYDGSLFVYEMNTYEEISFTTASLVTENGEVALANENGVLVGKCNSDVSADAGFIEGKIKLSDEDGDVYSNKIQIHVERMPE